MRLLILEERRLRETVNADGGTVTIGSDPSCRVHLPDPRVGRHQLSITQDDEGLWWLDLKDLSVPTCLNRAIQKSRAKLRHADEIEIGNYTLRFFMESNKSREELERERLQALSRKHLESLPLDTIILKEGADLTISREHLEQVLLLAMRLSQQETVAEAATILLKAMIRTFNARRAWAGIRRPGMNDFEWSLAQTQRGEPCERPLYSTTMQRRCLGNSEHICTARVPREEVGSAMAVPLLSPHGNLGMLYVENNANDRPYNKPMLNAFKALGSCVAVPIEMVLQQTVTSRRAAAATEQTIARATQDAVTPKALPQWRTLEIAAYRHMGTQQCCDFYDFVQLRDKTAAIVVARLCAEPRCVPRYLGELRATFRSAALYSEAPHLFARVLNWILHSAPGNRAVDMATAWVNPQTGVVQHCLAGRRVVIGRMTAEGDCRMVLPDDTPPIGGSRAAAFQSKTLQLAEGDYLVLATGGVNNAKNADEEAFGLEGLQENLCDGAGRSAAALLSEFSTDLTEYVSGGSNPDDISIVLLRRNSPEGP